MICSAYYPLYFSPYPNESRKIKTPLALVLNHLSQLYFAKMQL